MTVEIDWDEVEVETTVSTPVSDIGQAGPGISYWRSHARIAVGDPHDDSQVTILWMNGAVVDLWTANQGVYAALDATSGD
ncbi:hypothetical protein [Nocardia sp. NPDC003183]